MHNEQSEWISKVLFEWEYDRNVLVGLDPSRIDLKSKNGKLWSIHKPENSRNVSSLFLFKKAYEKSTKPDFDIVFSNEDLPRINWIKPFLCYATSKQNTDPSAVAPDYTFHSLGLKGKYGSSGEANDSYAELVNEMIEAGKQPPLTDKAGWCGNPGLHHRIELIKACNTPPLSDVCDVIEMNWGHPKREDGWPQNFMTLPQQVQKWRFIIDVQGMSWADRTKFFFFSNRVILYHEREFNEYYFKDLIPWVHYVPIKNFNDYKPMVEKLLSNPLLENSIKENAFKFAQENLLQEHAIEYLRKIIDETDWKAKTLAIESATITRPPFVIYAHRPLPSWLTFEES
jgi:hypothetical protein